MFFAFKAAMFSRAITLLEYIMVYINARDSTFRTVDEFDKIIFTVCIRAPLNFLGINYGHTDHNRAIYL